MPKNASIQGVFDFFAPFALVRPVTFTTLLFVASIWIYLYTRKAVKYRVCFLILDVPNIVVNLRV